MILRNAVIVYWEEDDLKESIFGEYRSAKAVYSYRECNVLLNFDSSSMHLWYTIFTVFAYHFSYITAILMLGLKKSEASGAVPESVRKRGFK